MPFEEREKLVELRPRMATLNPCSMSFGAGEFRNPPDGVRRLAARMRELALAIRAIWACWHEGAPLRFDGDFYRHTLMTPFFNPGPNPYDPPRMWLAGVGPASITFEKADGSLHAEVTGALSMSTDQMVGMDGHGPAVISNTPFGAVTQPVRQGTAKDVSYHGYWSADFSGTNSFITDFRYEG